MNQYLESIRWIGIGILFVFLIQFATHFRKESGVRLPWWLIILGGLCVFGKEVAEFIIAVIRLVRVILGGA